jgi:hypothetical protein
MYQELHVFMTNGIRESKFPPIPDNSLILYHVTCAQIGMVAEANKECRSQWYSSPVKAHVEAK